MDYLRTLRNRKTAVARFRAAADAMSVIVVRKMRALLTKRRVARGGVVVVIILRSGIVMLGAAARAFPNASIGVVGLKRDETTFEPHWYYENLPRISARSAVVICDPMLATGGTAEAVVERLLARGAARKRIYFVGIVAAPEGLTRLSSAIPRENIILGSLDKGLNARKMIVPGIGDFGDRYFGYHDGGLHGALARL